MSPSIFTPQNNQKLTNVAVVRLRCNGVRFEIACYKNKLQDYRNNPVSTPLSEVLQSDQVFLNVSKGLLAKAQDLQRAFGSTDSTIAIREPDNPYDFSASNFKILDRGEGQVGAAERSHLTESMRRDIAVIIAEKTLNPENGRPYTPSMIERVLVNDVHLSIRTDDTAKQQALEIIRQLEQRQPFPIVRRDRSQ